MLTNFKEEIVKNIEILINYFKSEGIVFKINEKDIDIYFNHDYEITEEQLSLIRSNKENIINYLSGVESRKSLIPQIDIKEDIILSSSQKRLWILSQDPLANIAYNINSYYEITGSTDISILNQIFTELISRHEILRTNFITNQFGEPYQHIRTMKDINFSVNEINTTNNILNEILEKESKKPFSLEKDLLLRINLFKTKERKEVLMLSMHHIITDAWSMDILIKEFFILYRNFQFHENNILPELSIQYKDYTYWQKNSKQKSSKEYWLKEYSPEEQYQPIDLCNSKERPTFKSYNGNICKRTVSKKSYSQLKNILKDENISVFSGLLGLFNILVAKYTKQQNIIIGTPVAGREHSQLENQIGFYVNTIAIKNAIDVSDSIIECLKKVSIKVIEGIENQSFPFDELIGDLQLKTDISRNPLFDIMFVFQNSSELNIEKYNNLGLHIQQYTPTFTQHTSKFDVLINIYEENQNLEIVLEYNTDIYEKYFIENLIDNYVTLINNFINDIGQHQKISSLDIVSKEEKQKILVDFNNTSTDYPIDKTIIQLFEEQVDKTPDNIAVICEDEKLTYRQLNQQANQLANYIKVNYSVSPQKIINRLERGKELLISLLATIKCNCTYIPCSNKERLEYIIGDCSTNFIIDDEFMLDFEKVRHEYSDMFKVGRKNINKTLYIIYTSGSTGEPKGVTVPDSTIINLIEYQQKHYIDIPKKISFFSNQSFDVSIQEIFSALLTGAALIAFTDLQKKNLTHFFNHVKDYNVDTLFLPTAFFSLIAEHEDEFRTIIPHIKNIFVAGEKLYINSKFYSLFDKNCFSLFNHYGPSETHVITSFKINFVEEIENVPIGSPISNTSIFILDEHFKILPIGVSGNLYVSGIGLSLGYLNKDKLTNEKFVKNPFEKDVKMYSTGDIAKWLPDGNIEYIGRADSQVKIRGFRVELGEVENSLKQFNDISQSIVVSKKINNENILVAYYTTYKGQIAKSKIKHFLESKLPEYMIPTYFVQLKAFSLNSNGKIDRKQLPVFRYHLTQKHIPPTTETQLKLAELWESVLGAKKISINSNFFDIGGTSIKAIKIIHEINKTLHANLLIYDFFKAKNIKELSKIIDLESNIIKIVDVYSEPIAEENCTFFFPPISGDSSIYENIYQKIKFDSKIYGINLPITHSLSIKQIAKLCADNLSNIMKSQKKNVLFSYSFGCLIAFETTKILEKKGYEVILIIVDKEVQKTNFNNKLSELSFPNSIQEHFSCSMKAMSKYIVKGKIKSPIYAFEAKENQIKSNMIEWKSFTLGKFEHFMIESNHWDIFENKNNIISLSNCLTSKLKKC